MTNNTQTYDTVKIRGLLAAFDDVDLDSLCLNFFPKVYDEFSRGLRRDEKITLLLDYCRRRPDECKQLESKIQDYLASEEISDTERQEKAKLRRFLVDRFGLDELQSLVFDLGIDYQSLRHQTTRELALDLMAYCTRRNKLGCLVEEILRQRDADFLAQLLAKLPPCAPSKKIQIIMSAHLLRNGVSESELRGALAATLGVDAEQIAVLSAAWDSLRLLTSLPERAADLLMSAEMPSLGESERRIESIEAFGSLDTASQEAWRLLVHVGASFREEGTLHPTVFWREVLELSGRRLSLEEIHGLLEGERVLPLWLVNCDLSGIDLSGTDLHRAYLYRANLSRADLRGSNLRGANLRKADLSGADLREADLREADLRDADLHRAKLHGAIIDDPNLH